MDKKEGYQFAVENGYLIDRGNFYKLFKSIARLKTLTAAEKILLSMVVSYTDRGLEFKYSNNGLTIEMGMGYASVARILNSLRDKGYIKTYKVYDRGKRVIIGRTIVPQKNLLSQELEKSWNDFEYIEYGKEEDEL